MNPYAIAAVSSNARGSDELERLTNGQQKGQQVHKLDRSPNGSVTKLILKTLCTLDAHSEEKHMQVRMLEKRKE